MFIHERLKETGVPPSFEEMKEALDLRSKSGIHRLVTALEERGFIRRLPHRARALEVVKLPDAMSPSLTAQRSTGFSPSVIEGSLGKKRPVEDHSDAGDAEAATVPLMGRIAAGVPISAIQEHSHNLAVPPEMLGAGEHYALEVNGDSMIEAGKHGEVIFHRLQRLKGFRELVPAARIGRMERVLMHPKRNVDHKQPLRDSRLLRASAHGRHGVEHRESQARPRTAQNRTTG